MESVTQATVPSQVSSKIEDHVAQEPVNANIRSGILAAVGVSIAASLLMQMMNRKNEALFIGQWAPTLMSVALWYQIVKTQRN